MSKIIDKDKMINLIDRVRNKLDVLSHNISFVQGGLTDIVNKLENKDVWFSIEIRMNEWTIGGDDLTAWVLFKSKEMIEYDREDEAIIINICDFSKDIADVVSELKSVFMNAVEAMNDKLIEVLGKYYNITRGINVKPEAKMKLGDITAVFGKNVVKLLVDDVKVIIGETVEINAKSKDDIMKAVEKLNSNIDKLYIPNPI